MSRSHENEIEIDAPPADVWRALTEGQELARWFAVAAEVEPGEGGRWKVSWDESPPAEYGRIGAWEPQKHLRLVHEGERGGQACVMIEDFELVASPDGARTILRIVASGFGDDASWDDEFEGTKNGWAVFLRNLRHYLERHRDQPCEAAGIPIAGVAGPRERAFERVFGPAGALAIADGPLVEGRRVELDAGFTRLHGEIDFARAPALLGVRVDELGLVRAEFVGSGETLFVHVMLLAHGPEARARIDAIHRPLTAALEAALRGGQA